MQDAESAKESSAEEKEEAQEVRPGAHDLFEALMVHTRQCTAA